MLTKDLLVSRKDDLQNLAAGIGDADLDLLVEWLREKDDTLRYAAFLLLQILSAKDDRVYRRWETFSAMTDDADINGDKKGHFCKRGVLSFCYVFIRLFVRRG